ncbi:hypothetical protein H7K45_27910 [Mycobacterium yunnanensis]|uniref:Uncharacterized protein n=1 Tax=Mycobacterium yunnanensis TaxID=368477 RepID=A0A9X2YRP7_9MYCO|nr:hypothetical protein [Mycobacterium yunnanensis]MCV7424377.1 hypothetical protein [Mycobacterium yunnanensis]
MSAGEQSLWERAREAAQVIDEVFQRDPWSPVRDSWAEELRAVADQWERAAAEEEAREQLADDLAASMYGSLEWNHSDGVRWRDVPEDSGVRARYLRAARDLLMSFDVRQVEVPF